jgi:dTDP-glucose pyrophosphorylase
MEPNLEIIMPMAGWGRRFRSEGINSPKPLIQVEGKPLFVWALASLQPLWPHVRVSVISVEKDNLATEVCTTLTKLGISNRSLTIPVRTKGPSETVSIALQEFNITGKFISLDCDLYFQSSWLIHNLLHWPPEVDGILPSFKSKVADFSYAASKDGIVSEVREKVVISEDALAGCYAFSDPKRFLEITESCLTHNAQEIYISQVIQKMIDLGSRFVLLPTEEHLSLGTPVQLRSSAVTLKEAAFSASLGN